MTRLLRLALLAAGAMARVSAQDDSGDAPDHGVARLSLMNGNVSVAHGDTGDLTAAVINAPLVATDRVLTAENSRAEIQFDGLNMVRLAPMTEVRLGELQYKRYLVQVAQGTVTLRVMRDSDAQVEVSTPNSSLRPLRQGTYRITVHGDGTSEVTVRDGDADLYSPSGSEPIRAGTTVMSRGSASDPEFRTVNATPQDDWDRWNIDRDRAFEHASETSRYVSPDIYGTEELSGHGRWAADPQYGNVWVPNVSDDWAPYRDGRWSYIDYYGWSWVSYDPWGWAPYHYGRWYRGGFGWAWYPGPVAARYYWRPALVGFFGWGSPAFGVTAGFGFGNVGWVPLAPYEPFRPWYGRNGYGGRGINITNVNVVNVYRNARFSGSVTSLRAGDFGRSHVDRRNFVRGTDGDFSRAGMIHGSMPFSPSRAGRQFVNRDVNSQAFPRGNGNTRFFSTRGRSPDALDRGGFSGSSDRGGWRRIDAPNPGGPAGSVGGDRGRFPRSQDGRRDGVLDRGRQDRPFGGGDTGGFRRAPRGQEPVQIRPPIVTDRNAERRQGNDDGFRSSPGSPFGGNSGFGNFGGSRRGGDSRPPEISRPQEDPRNEGGRMRGGPFGDGGFRSPPPADGVPRGGGNRDNNRPRDDGGGFRGGPFNDGGFRSAPPADGGLRRGGNRDNGGGPRGEGGGFRGGPSGDGGFRSGPPAGGGLRGEGSRNDGGGFRGGSPQGGNGGGGGRRGGGRDR